MTEKNKNDRGPAKDSPPPATRASGEMPAASMPAPSGAKPTRNPAYDGFSRAFELP